MRPPTGCHDLSGAVEVTYLHVEELPSGELLYRSYRYDISKMNNQHHLIEDGGSMLHKPHG
jgi:hypothetical protein